VKSIETNKQKVRVRFAPSPTGQVHVGNARTALFNWLYARQKGGTYVLRIEDTDLERSEARYEQQLMDDLKWLGLDWDEGPDMGGPFPPYRQSERLGIYHDYAERLLREDKAYLCFCPAEQLEQERERALTEHLKPPTSCPCAKVAPAEMQARRAAGEAAAIRLRIPDRPIRFRDMVRGVVEFSNEAVSDPIIVRSSGMPVYNYVVVVDDALMEITHVVRGDDHLSNTPKQVVLYDAFNWHVPEFAHLSTILGADRTRLSKRHGAVSIRNFRDSGVVPEALLNYLALLGWAPSGGDREIFSKQELIEAFDLERVTPSSAVFDMEKLYWLNRHYIKESPPERIVELGWEYFRELVGVLDEKAMGAVRDWFAKVILLFAPAVNKLDELPEKAKLITKFDPIAAVASPENAEVLAGPKTQAVLESFARHVESEAVPLTAERFKAIMNEVKKESGAKGKELFHPVRVALTGAHSGPEFDKLIPLIEEGSRLPLRVPGVRERIRCFLEGQKAARATN
jgi:nondiscriminating glutamyl-tRNA synthetase